MEPLKLNRMWLSWLGVYPPDENASSTMKFICSIFPVIVLCGDLAGLFAGATFFLRSISVDLESAMYSLCQIAGLGNMAYMMIVSFFLRQKFTDTINGLMNIYRENSDEDSMRFLDEANTIGEWICKMFLIFALGGTFVSTWMISIVSVLLWSMGDTEFDGRQQFRLFNIIVPWSQQTKLGYFAEIWFHIYYFEAYYISGSFLLLFIVLCLYHHAFYKMVEFRLRKLDQPERNFDGTALIHQLISFHNSTKRLFKQSADAYSPFVFVHLICTVIVMAAFVFKLDLQFQHIDVGILFIMGVAVSDALSPFLFCLFGKLATNCYEKMSDSIFESNWCVLPVRLQKCFIVVIGIGQRPIYYHGFDVMVLNLETFTALLKTVFSYYMIFKTVTKI